MQYKPSNRLATLALIVAVLAANASAADLRPQIESLVEPLLKADAVVGLVIGVVKDGQTQLLAFGETAKGSGESPDGKTVYEIGSATKVFTGILLADAVQSGRMKLEDPVQQYLPKQVTMPSVDGKTITLEHLATHTSGLPRLPNNFRPKNPANPYADYTGKHLSEGLKELKLKRPPGEYEYSNLGMGLLGQVIARNAGKSYEALLKERIAGPLKMDDTSIKLNASQRQRLAPPYNAALENDHNWDIPTLAGAGAIRSTADDMLRFLEANLAEDDLPLTKTLQFARAKRHPMKDGRAMGLGWHLARDGITWCHDGMTGGYASWISVTPKLGIGVVVLANTATMKIPRLGEQVVQVAAGVPIKLPTQRQEVAVDPAALEKYVGVYEIVPQFKLAVTLEAGQLMVQATDQPKFPVFAESPTEFFYKVVDDDGRVKELILRQNGRDMTGKREDDRQNR